MQVNKHLLFTPIFLAPFSVFPAFGAFGFRVPLSLIILIFLTTHIICTRKIEYSQLIKRYLFIVILFMYVTTSLILTDYTSNYLRMFSISFQFFCLLTYVRVFYDPNRDLFNTFSHKIISVYLLGLNSSLLIGLLLFTIPSLESILLTHFRFMYQASESISRFRGLTDEPIVVGFFCYCGLICTITTNRKINSLFLLVCLALTLSSLLVFYAAAMIFIIYIYISKKIAVFIISIFIFLTYVTGVLDNAVIYYQFATKVFTYINMFASSSQIIDSGGFRAMNTIFSVKKYFSDFFPFAVGPGNSTGFLYSGGSTLNDDMTFRANTPIQNSFASLLIEFGLFSVILIYYIFFENSKSLKRSFLIAFCLFPPLLFVYPLYNVGIYISTFAALTALSLKLRSDQDVS